MKKFIELDYDKQKEIIEKDQELREKLERYISESEMEYLQKKISCFKRGSIDYSYGPWEMSWMSVLDDNLFIKGVEESDSTFGLGEKTQKLLNQCKNLRGTNLYHYMVGKLCEMYFEEEFQAILNYVEDCGQELYHGEIGEKCGNYLDCFIDNYLSDYLYDEDEETLYEPFGEIA